MNDTMNSFDEKFEKLYKKRERISEGLNNLESKLMKGFLSITEASNYLGLKESELNELATNGSISYSKPFNEKLYFTQSNLNEFLQRASALNEEININK